MKLSIKSQYALESLLAIGIAKQQGGVPVSIRDLAETRGIPERFLGQILSNLRKAGLLVSVRGVHGGYLLARRPADISVGEVIRALEGPLAVSVKGSLGGYQPADSLSRLTAGAILRVLEGDLSVIDNGLHSGDQDPIRICQQTKVWDVVNRSIPTTADGITMTDLAERMRGRAQGIQVHS